MDDATIRALHELRRAEKEQALFYRALAALADDEDADIAERLNGLHADEQHHLSRLSARLLEMGERLDDLRGLEYPAAILEGWEVEARRREREEIQRYLALLDRDLDEATAALAADSLRVERLHERTLSGKYTGS